MDPSFYHVTNWIKRHGPVWLQGVKLPLFDSLDGVINARGKARFTTYQHNALAILTNKRATLRRDRQPEAALISVLVNYTSGTQPKTAAIIQRVGRKMARALRRRNSTANSKNNGT